MVGTCLVLFGRELVKQDLENDQGRRNAVVLEGTVQVTLLPAGPCRMVVGHIVAVVDAVDLVTDTVIAIETAHYHGSDYHVSKWPLESCFTYCPD